MPTAPVSLHELRSYEGPTLSSLASAAPQLLAGSPKVMSLVASLGYNIKSTRGESEPVPMTFLCKRRDRSDNRTFRIVVDVTSVDMATSESVGYITLIGTTRGKYVRAIWNPFMQDGTFSTGR